MDQVSLAQALVPNSNYQPIRAGGQSSSETLNLLFRAVQNDLRQATDDLENLASYQSRALSAYGLQLQALAQVIQATRIALPSSSGLKLVDFYAPENITSVDSGMINSLYGQATAPVVATQSLLQHKDSAGDVWIVDGTSIGVARNSGTVPNENDYLPEDEIRYALDGRLDTAWMVPVNGYSNIWVSVSVPLLYTTRKANAIVILPFPMFGVTVSSVSVYADGVWSNLDLSYLPGYDATSGVLHAGPMRLFFSERNVSRIRVQMLPDSGIDYVGLMGVDVQRIEFAPVGNLSITLTGATITDVVVYGMNPAQLAGIAGIAGNTVNLSIRSYNTVESQVVTGVGISYS